MDAPNVVVLNGGGNGSDEGDAIAMTKTRAHQQYEAGGGGGGGGGSGSVSGKDIVQQQPRSIHNTNSTLNGNGDITDIPQQLA